MSIAITVKGNQMCPTAFCETCGKEITDASRGMYAFFGGKAGHLLWDEGSTTQLYTLHNVRECSFPFEQEKLREYGGVMGWMPLDIFPVYFCNNTGIDFKEASEHAVAFL